MSNARSPSSYQYEMQRQQLQKQQQRQQYRGLADQRPASDLPEKQHQKAHNAISNVQENHSTFDAAMIRARMMLTGALGIFIATACVATLVDVARASLIV